MTQGGRQPNHSTALTHPSHGSAQWACRFFLLLLLPLVLSACGGSGSDDPPTPEVIPSLASLGNVSATYDGGTVNLSFDIVLAPAAAEAVSVDYQVSSGGVSVQGVTAQAATLPLSGSVTFGPGESHKSVNLTFTVPGLTQLGIRLGSASGNIILDGSSSFSFTPTDITPPPPEPVPDPPPDPIAYYAIGVSANPLAGGSTSGGGSYPEGGTVTVTAIPAVGYEFVNWTEGGVQVSASASYSFMVTTNRTLVANFQTLPVVSIADATDPGGTSSTADLVFTVSLSRQANGDVTVDYATADSTAFAGRDYTAASGTLTISSGTTSNTITVAVLTDGGLDTGTFIVNLSNVSANATLGTATATGTLVGDDHVPGRLNDTAITTCSDNTTNGLACPQATHPGQDAEYGRDANPLTNSNIDGHAGFSFTKLDGSGTPLADQSVAYATTPWACVKDRVTGLMWEVKTDDGSLHDKDWTYSWYNPDPATNGGNAGTESNGNCGGTVAAGCDTQKFVTAVNAAGLCGFNDWRLPNVRELDSLVDSSIGLPGPNIDTGFFPNTRANGYWTSLTVAAVVGEAWAVSLIYGGVEEYQLTKDIPFSARLVRLGQ